MMPDESPEPTAFGAVSSGIPAQPGWANLAILLANLLGGQFW